MSGKSHTNQTGHASHTSHTSHTAHTTSAAGRELKHVASTEHKAAHAAYEVDRKIREVEVLASGNPRRIRRYFMRKFAYRLFGKLMGKTINRL
jgi:hypothetical protein